MNDPEKIIKAHYYIANKRWEKFCKLRDSIKNKTKKEFWSREANEMLEIKLELASVYYEIYEKGIGEK